VLLVCLAAANWYYDSNGKPLLCDESEKKRYSAVYVFFFYKITKLQYNYCGISINLLTIWSVHYTAYTLPFWILLSHHQIVPGDWAFACNSHL